MSEVKRYFVFWNDQIYSENKDGDIVMAADFDRVTAERDALQQRLTAADERVDVLETALRKIKLRLDAYAESDMRMPEPSVEVCQAIADAALKPAEVLQIAGFKVVEDPSIPPGQIRMCNCNQGRLPCTCKPSAYDGFDNGVD